MASLSGPNPLSIGEFNAAGAATGAGTAADGITTLGNTLAGGPVRAAQGAYLGAETGAAQAKTAATNRALADGQQITSLLGPQPDGTMGIARPENVQGAAAIVARNPDVAAQFPHTLATMFQAAAMNTPSGSQPAAAADRFSAGTGVAAAGNTFTGQKLDNQRALAVAGTEAGATRYSADQRLKGETYNADKTYAASVYGVDHKLIPTDGGAPTKDGVPAAPILMTNADAGKGGVRGYEPTVANTIADHMTKPVTVQGPGGTSAIVTTGQAINSGANPRPSSPAEVQGNLVQDSLSPPKGGSPVTPEQSAAIREAAIATATNRAAPGQGSMADAAALDTQISKRIMALNPTLIGKNVPSQELLDPIRLQATWIHDHDPAVRGDWNAAITKAVTNVTGGGLDQDLHFPWKPGDSQTVLKDGAQIKWPDGMAVPPQYAQTAPAGGPSPVAQALSGQNAPPPAAPPPPPAGGPSPLAAALTPAAQAAPVQPPPAPPPAPVAPAQAAPVQNAAAPSPQALAALKEGMLTTFANGQVWTLQNGQPVRVK